MRGISGFLQRSRDDARGTISILGAFVLVGVVGVSALALEYGHALLQKSEDQRVADLAAYGGALVYGSTGSESSATSAASNIAALNGLSSGVTPSVVSSPTGDGNNAVEVAVATNVPLMLARVVTTNTTLPVSATAYAEIERQRPGLHRRPQQRRHRHLAQRHRQQYRRRLHGSLGQHRVRRQRGEPERCVDDQDYRLRFGFFTCVEQVHLDAAIGHLGGPAQQDSDYRPAGRRQRSLDGDQSAHYGIERYIAKRTLVTGRFGWKLIKLRIEQVNRHVAQWLLGGTFVVSPVWTVTCTGSGPLTFGSIAKNGGVTVQINTLSGVTYNFNGSIIGGVSLAGTNAGIYNVLGSITTSGTTSFAPGTYNVSGSITTGGTATFGAGTYDIVQGITIGGGSTATFGAGTFYLGTASCSGTSGYSICNTGTSLIIGGPSTFKLEGGIYNGGGAILSLGSGSTNSYTIGKASDGNSINVSTSKSTTLADATGSGDIFETAGSIVSGGGTCFWIPAAAEHDINGYISLAGGTILGAGVYTVTDYVALGASSGGSETCGGTSVGVSGSGVTLVIGGTTTVSCGGTTGQAFCVGAGFDPVILTAPSSGNTVGLVMVGPTTTSANPDAGAWFGQGASSSVFSGAVYFPNGPIDMSGSATLGNGTGACLELIGSQVTLSAGTAVGSTCTGLGGGSTGTTVSLVQ